jgi:hypothetical protein
VFPPAATGWPGTARSVGRLTEHAPQVASQRRKQVERLEVGQRQERGLQSRFLLPRLLARRYLTGQEHHVHRAGAAVWSQHLEYERHPRRIYVQTRFLSHLAPGTRCHALAVARRSAR